MPFHTKKHFSNWILHKKTFQAIFMSPILWTNGLKKRLNEYLFFDLGNGHFAAGAVEVEA